MKKVVINNPISPVESYEIRLRRAYLGMINTIERELGKKQEPSELFGLAVMLAMSVTEAENIKDSLDNADVFNDALRQALATNHNARTSNAELTARGPGIGYCAICAEIINSGDYCEDCRDGGDLEDILKAALDA